MYHSDLNYGMLQAASSSSLTTLCCFIPEEWDLNHGQQGRLLSLGLYLCTDQPRFFSLVYADSLRLYLQAAVWSMCLFVPCFLGRLGKYIAFLYSTSPQKRVLSSKPAVRVHCIKPRI